MHFLLFSPRGKTRIARQVNPVAAAEGCDKLRRTFSGCQNDARFAVDRSLRQRLYRPLQIKAKPSILQPWTHCNAASTNESRAVPQAVQSVTCPAPQLPQTLGARPLKHPQTLDLPGPQRSGPGFALRFYKRNSASSQ
ncbi:hypothetical protein C4K15_5562 [Pseudomonas chlororaphis subsp. aurantiaca]|nr:hypothetical protein C4K17_5794 [Pseudomonas chlororaphis subsp. aurantiaca]AZD82094.1 hypothetical protein C4K15_5562 [Pseudomonas chlororaphis subsp. aurantiaca]